MKKLMILVLFCVITNGYSADKFWIALPSDDEPVGQPIKMMQIDEFGNVLKSPVNVLSASQTGSCTCEQSAAMSYDSKGNIILWIANDIPQEIYRAVLNPTSLSLVKGPVRISVSGADIDWFHATNPAHLLAFEKPAGVLKGFTVDANGVLTGSSVRLNPRYDKKDTYRETSIAADGGMAVSAKNLEFLAVQPLRSTGVPIGDPVLLADHMGREDPDITSLLPNGRRFVVYADQDSRGRGLIVIDGITGNKLGVPKILDTLNQGENNDSMVVDPEGRFVLFNVDDADAGCSAPANDPLFFLALNPNTGDPVGEPKQLTDCHLFDNTDGVFGISLLKVR